MSQETNKKNPENSKKPNFKLRRIGATVATLAAAATLVAGADTVKNVAAQSHGNTGTKTELITPSPNSIYAGEEDENITSVTISDGARLRSEPVVSDFEEGAPSNVVDTTDSTMKIKGNKKVLVHYDVNGEWFGVPADSLMRVDPDLKLRGDSDGYVWVNEQKASAETSQVVDNSKQ
jgi:hypothetical protein